jgi:hypothetical protein
MGGAIRGSSAFSQRLDFTAQEVVFSPDSRTLMIAFTYEKRSGGPEWAVIDLPTMAMRDAAPELCARQPPRVDDLTDVQASPDGAFVLGRQAGDSPAASGLFMSAAAGGPLTKVSAFNPDYFFMRQGDVIVLTRYVFPAESAEEGGVEGIYVRTYDLRRQTYLDPRTLEPVPSSTADQLVLPRSQYAGLTPFDAIGLGPTGRNLVFVGQAQSDGAPALAPLKATLDAKGEMIAYDDRLLFLLDRQTGELRLHPLMEQIQSNPVLLSRMASPRIALVQMAENGDLYFVLRNLPVVFRYRDGAFSAVMAMPRQLDVSRVQSFAVSPDEKWLALRVWAPDSADVNALVANADGKLVFRVDRSLARPAVCRPASESNACFTTKSVDHPCF